MKTILTLLATTLLTLTGFSQFQYDKMYSSKLADGTHSYFMISETGAVVMAHSAEGSAQVKTWFESKEPHSSLAKAQGKIKEGTKASFVITLDGNKSNCIATGSDETVSMIIMAPGAGKQELTFKLIK
jgi:hypothetical protein